ncbi:hypothetical protein BV25DRAFT_669877 [Artomyces pyxidatus]|uniref:Uncharacterized protein n=1 Tax=Artomyces pyxidatus TaxID=48021 RepID=A0ACB8T2T3_9AGAM|nr:hypothetical protein BV25DRAFT_669877 [Artomyces pyxidatus]
MICILAETISPAWSVPNFCSVTFLVALAVHILLLYSKMVHKALSGVCRPAVSLRSGHCLLPNTGGHGIKIQETVDRRPPEFIRQYQSSRLSDLNNVA